MRVVLAVLTLALASAAPAQSVDDILQAYIKAVGGQTAIDGIHTRRAQVTPHRGIHLTLYWAAPNQVLREGRRQKEGFDGGVGWVETKKKSSKNCHAHTGTNLRPTPIRSATCGCANCTTS